MITLHFALPAYAAPPTLQPAGALPTFVKKGEAPVFRLTYRDADGDRPRDLTMVLQKPSGTARIPAAQAPSGNYRNGITVEWKPTFDEGGTYRIHFEAASSTGPPGRPETRYPEDANAALEVTVYDPVHQWVMLGVGVAVALLFIPMMLFFVLRGMSRNLDPGATARFALLVGILAAAAWYGYLFWNIYGVTSVAIVGVIALGVAFVLATMRR